VTRYGTCATLSSLVSLPFIAVGVLLVIDVWNIGSAEPAVALAISLPVAILVRHSEGRQGRTKTELGLVLQQWRRVHAVYLFIFLLKKYI